MALVPPHLAHSRKNRIRTAKPTARIWGKLCCLEVIKWHVFVKWQLIWGKPRHCILPLIPVPCDLLHPKQTHFNLPGGQDLSYWSILLMDGDMQGVLGCIWRCCSACVTEWEVFHRWSTPSLSLYGSNLRLRVLLCYPYVYILPFNAKTAPKVVTS